MEIVDYQTKKGEKNNNWILNFVFDKIAIII